MTPVLKKHGLDLNDLTNYRPVSNLQFIGKVLAKVVAEQLTHHLDAHSLRDDLQSVYRPGHSVETALLKTKDDMDMALDWGDGILVVLLDLRAAFDTLDHHILLDRLKHTCGLTDKVHQWLASYLGGRTQQVKVGESLSKPKQLNMGVPQGSVLGPLLFSIYYQPVTAIVRKHGCSYHVYADDMQIYVCFKPTSPASLLEAIGRMETCIVEIQQWMTTNKLRLNSAKTELMVAVSPHHQRLVEEAKPVLRIGDSVIYPRASVRNLGVIFDSQMTMRPRVNSIIRSANAHLRSLGRIRRYTWTMQQQRQPPGHLYYPDLTLPTPC